MTRTRVWVKGYIAALEDMIVDIDNYVHGSKYALKIRTMVSESLTTARETLDQLSETKETT